MKFTFGLAALAALASLALGRPSHDLVSRADDTVKYNDPETGLTFAEFRFQCTLTLNIIYRVALPSNAPSGAYDAVVQVVTPSQIGWNGFAWGGSMVRNPLTVAYPNSNKVTVSSRWATAHTTPQTYATAAYTLLTKGNKVNGSHWQYTAKCSGCTTWTGTAGSVRINPNSASRVAMACSTAKPSSPGSNTSTIPGHDSFYNPTFDFSKGLNPNFADLVGAAS